MEPLHEIKRKLRELRCLDSKLRLWGAANHGYRPHAVLRRKEIQRYERKYQITFPEEYAAFLIEVGDGGAGPGVGPYRLCESYCKT